MSGSHHRLKWILFENKRLPEWAGLLDLAATMSPNSAETRGWFKRFTRSSGVDDARSVVEVCGLLRTNLHANRQAIMAELGGGSDGSEAVAIIMGWTLALDTMIHKATSLKTCSWLVEEHPDSASRPQVGAVLKLRRA